MIRHQNECAEWLVILFVAQ